MSVVGTVEYMAPEVAFSMEYNESADVFSYGLVLACALIARAKDADADEFRGADFALEEKRFRRKYRRGVPPAFLDLTCQCALAKPVDRPSFVQILARLRLVELRLPIDLGQLGTGALEDGEADAEDSDAADLVLFTQPQRDLIFAVLAEIGFEATEATRDVIENTAKTTGLKKPYWLLNDEDYKLGEDRYRLPIPPKPSSTLANPTHEALLDAVAVRYGGVTEITKDAILELAAENGLKK
jgi:serine/threonine protein kinase